jgi:BirA family transcriptional regulator, biotin operon repressor / biotin---[acetyl-CoA-carboxylase] ligase
MSFERSRADGLQLTVLETTGSTNADLLAVAAATPHLGAIVSLGQTAGRGRLDRTWVAPPGRVLAASVLVRADLTDADRGWLPLVAGAAMREAIVSVLPADSDVVVKWPNDVQIDGDKVCGILCQVASDGSVVVGAGVNLTIPADELPTPTATSLSLHGAVLPGSGDDAADLADRVLVAFRAAVLEAVAGLAAGGPAAESVRSAVRAVCGTIGRRVRVELPSGDVLEATATDLDDEGRLVVRGDDGALTAVSVGDVTHLRYA